jgi:hypothetical protein
MKYDDRHGGPFDRGSADYYYSRPYSPHYFVGGTGQSERITELTAEECDAYEAGWDDADKNGDKKTW